MKNEFSKRAGLLVTLFVLLWLYFPINRFVSGGMSTQLPVDDYIKLSPIWAIPYLLSIPWWLGSLVWATKKMEYKLFLQSFYCLALAIVASYVIYVVFPTYAVRPEITGSDFLSGLVTYIYGNDRPYNALPSGHTYITLIIAVFWSRWIPKYKPLWVLIAILILLSTLFTKQHAILDLLASMLLVYICDVTSNRIMKLS